MYLVETTMRLLILDDVTRSELNSLRSGFVIELKSVRVHQCIFKWNICYKIAKPQHVFFNMSSAWYGDHVSFESQITKLLVF